MLRQLLHNFNVTDTLIIYLVVKRLIITKNSVVKIQNLIVDDESQPVKSNLAY